MPKRPTQYCDACESTVCADDVHSCFDAKAERAQRERERTLTDAERRVVEAAEEMVAAYQDGMWARACALDSEMLERGIKAADERYESAWNTMQENVRALRAHRTGETT